MADNGRKLVNNELVYENGRYFIDFEDFERKITGNGVKLFILCSPHNPVGRVWTVEELARIGEICLQNGVIVVSDEIHSDFTYEGHTHTIFASISRELEQRSIICTSPSKTFNLAGLQISNFFIPDAGMREKIRRQIRITGYDENNIFGLTACRAAYRYGESWLAQLKECLKENRDFVRDCLEERIPEIKLVEPEGTYLLWLDCREMEMSDKELEGFFLEKAKLWLDEGSMFGRESGQFMRVNIACPRDILQKAMRQLEEAVREKKG